MNGKDAGYTRFALVREMLETPGIIRGLPVDTVRRISDSLGTANGGSEKVFFTGEGSSRILPAKKTIYDALSNDYTEYMQTEGATQALEYDLKDWAVFAASNSGRTKEVVRLLKRLRAAGHDSLIALTANEGSPVVDVATDHYVLTAGHEDAVAATKTVVEQAVFYDLLFRMRNGAPMPDLAELGDRMQQALELPLPNEMIAPLAQAGTVYWAGRNDGVAEELTLKTNEITRKRADFLEGTYAVHGIEEVMDPSDVVVVVEPFEEEEAKFKEVLVDGVGLTVCAVSSRETSFPTIMIQDTGPAAPYVRLAAGWNLLVEVGINGGIDLDKPARARKVGNEL